MDIRTGTAIDVHAFSDDPDRPLQLACLRWPGERGLAGDSDGDVAAHAAADALLMATGIGELGTVFGVGDARWAGVSGAMLLKETCSMVIKEGWTISNITVQIVCQRPHFAPNKGMAEAAMASIVGAPVSVSATSTDHLGFTGNEEGILALASVLVTRA